ncbi:MAG TPA: hypothetical protein VL754_10600, partial [Verrucomicrobiae bacterium]|nr:hypothetical protein [Verrucomicrobiae bacterium]
MESQFDSAREAAGRSLVIFPGALGDFICFLPALDALARRGAVDVLARSEYADLVSPPIRIASIERREIAQLFVREADLREVEEFLRPYDRVYSWSGGGDAAFKRNFARAAGARGRLFPFRPAALTEHISDYYLGCIGAPAEAPTPEVAVKPEALARARAWLGINGNNR